MDLLGLEPTEGSYSAAFACVVVDRFVNWLVYFEEHRIIETRYRKSASRNTVFMAILCCAARLCSQRGVLYPGQSIFVSGSGLFSQILFFFGCF
jgi:hypothetical protein